MRHTRVSSPPRAMWMLVMLVVLCSVVGDVAGAEVSAVSGEWWQEVRRSIELDAYSIVRADDVAFRADNPAQRFEIAFDEDGVRLARRGDPDWEWGLALQRWGRPGALQEIGGAAMTVDGARVVLERGALTEWFVNSPEGLEHGFTVPVRPRGDGVMLLDLALGGSLRPVFDPEGRAVDFYTGDGVAALRYARLVVTDALGTPVAARLEPVAGGVRIVIDDAAAVYPLTVDPLATSASWTATGEASAHEFGYAVATAGDVNGDGYSDVVVGAWGFGSYRGKAYAFLGGAGGLATSASWFALGDAASDGFGRSVATAGDVNGDGYADVLVGASTGKAYLYLGGAAGLSPAASWTTTGAGGVVATAGDVNGDGYSDILIGDERYSSYAGRAFLHLGGPGGVAASAAWTALGEGPTQYFGAAVASAGDVNGDGFCDVVVGAYTYGASYAGKAYLYLGHAAGLSSVASWTVVGEGVGASFGRSVATAGDVNGDGYADVVVGADGFTSATGKAYVYPGGPSGLSTVASWSAVGQAVNDRFGGQVSTAGDVNGDGYADVVIGAASNTGYTGRAYVYLGGPTGLAAAATWISAGEGPNQYFGQAVSTAGDVNGDGFSDVVVGAYGYASSTGKAYVYFGGPGVLSNSASWTATGEAANDRYGLAVGSAGDVNGDGYSDVVVGAYQNNGSRGKAYLYLGAATGPSTAVSWSAVGEAALDLFGFCVASAGDVNADGFSDVVVGAYGFNGSVGKAYVYLGSASGLSPGASWTATGSVGNDRFAYSAAAAGDVDGDGFGDVVIGAYGRNSYTGIAYLYRGGAGGLALDPSWSATGEGTSTYYGSSVAAAGDVNGDGFGDVVVGAYRNNGYTGKAYLYAGAAGGLSPAASWTAVGEASSNNFARTATTAGDVNGDGYSDLIVGADGYSSFTGKAYVYLGGARGLPTAASWSVVGEGTSHEFAHWVATAGDVNGDGYSDVVVGAMGYATSTGRSYVFLGSASGLAPSAAWVTTGQATANYFGRSVATAGDVNGDGFSDLLVGAYGFNSSAGKTYLYFGGAEPGGGTILPRQRRLDLSAPIPLGGRAYEQSFRAGLTLRSPVGRVWRQLQWQLAPWGWTFDPRVNAVEDDDTWYRNPVARSVPVDLPDDLERYTWRARVRYHPANSPFVPWSPWFTVAGNALYETDLVSTSEPQPPPCITPDEEVYISTVTLDVNDNPVLHFQDPNQPADVTGYDVFRSSSATGPWTRIASNVVDMDAGVPNLQYVDSTGGGGATWYYEVAAVNGLCGASGPR